MTVLTVIGVVLFFVLLFWAIVKINDFTITKYRHEFFTWNSYFVYLLIYGGIYFGRNWYLKAVATNGDELNGILIVSFAVIILITMLVSNIKRSGFFFGLFITLLQVIVYIPFAVVGAIALLGIASFASQTRPVYNINSK